MARGRRRPARRARGAGAPAWHRRADSLSGTAQRRVCTHALCRRRRPALPVRGPPPRPSRIHGARQAGRRERRGGCARDGA
ncbi:MAG TPA: hypothetical protein DEP35_03645, partial [Deltaproteobacteria bacterium]|nr:hypothetical protein [Deltaproteobacteria bacterium]